MKIRELRTKRAELIAKARKLQDTADAEKRALTTDETTQFDRMLDESEELRTQVEKLERLETAEAEMRTGIDEAAERRRMAGEDPGDAEKRTAVEAKEKELRTKAFRSLLVGGHRSLSETEIRALSVGTPSEGGYTVAPEEFSTALIQAVDDLVYLRAWGTGTMVKSSNGLGIPTIETDPSDPAWTTEVLTGADDAAMTFGKRELRPAPLAKRIKVTKSLVRESALNVDAIIRQRLAYKFATALENSGMTGNGTGQYLGVFTASASGIPVARDVVGGTAALPTGDGLIDVKYGLKQQYWSRARWIFHQSIAKLVAKLKDTEGQYLWHQSLREGEPDMLLGLPMHMSQFSPSTIGTGNYFGILGDFSHFHYADVMGVEVQVLTELYAETNQNGYIGRMESDAMPVLAEAFVRAKFA